MRVMGADAVIEAIGIPYIRIVLCFTPFFMMNYAFTAFVRNDNAPHIAMAATLLSSLFNIVFDYIFIFRSDSVFWCCIGNSILPDCHYVGVLQTLSE